VPVTAAVAVSLVSQATSAPSAPPYAPIDGYPRRTSREKKCLVIANTLTSPSGVRVLIGVTPEAGKPCGWGRHRVHTCHGRRKAASIWYDSSGPEDSDVITVVSLLNVTCKIHTFWAMLRPSDLSLTVTGTFHASTLLTLYCTDSFSMFGVVGAEFSTNLIANSLLFDLVGLPSIISTLTGSKPSQTTGRVRLC
jgi:hypothetical protein